MRLNGRNIILLVAALVLIAVLIFLGNRRGDEAAQDATDATEATAETGPLFPELDQETITRFEIRELEQTVSETEEPAPVATDETGAEVPVTPPFVVMVKDEEGFWNIEEATNATDRGTDQVTVAGTMGVVASLEFADRFSLAEAEGELASFGLEEPAYEILLSDGETDYRLYMGNNSPGNTRYYVRLGDDTDTIYLVVSDLLDNVVRYIDAPPYVPPPTATPTPFPTANPYSEVEQTATAQAGFDMTATAVMEMTEIAEMTPIGPDAPTEEVTEESGS